MENKEVIYPTLNNLKKKNHKKKQAPVSKCLLGVCNVPAIQCEAMMLAPTSMPNYIFLKRVPQRVLNTVECQVSQHQSSEPNSVHI